MKKRLLPLAALFISGFAYSQVGVGTSQPSKSAQLEIKSNDKGLLIPRVALTGVKDASTITAGNEFSLLVFNTASNSNIKPGYFYWNGNEWSKLLSGDDATSIGNLKFDIDGDNLILKEVNGENKITIALDKLNKETTLKDEGNGSYVYTNEKGDKVTINVKETVIKNFQDVINNDKVKELIEKIVKEAEGIVTYDENSATLNYTDATGKTKKVDISKLIKGFETITTLEKKGDGTYVYENEAGAKVTIDVKNDVINNFSEVVKNKTIKEQIEKIAKEAEGIVTYDATSETFKYSDSNGQAKDVNISKIVKANESETKLKDNGDGTYSFESEKGNKVTIDVKKSITNNPKEVFNNDKVKEIIKEIVKDTEGVVTYDTSSNTLNYVDRNGNTQKVDIAKIVKDNETKTSIELDSDGNLVYRGEDTTIPPTTISVPNTVSEHFTKILSDPKVQSALQSFVQTAQAVQGSVMFDGTTFSYKDSSGAIKTLSVKELVKLGETRTFITDKQDGTYVYTNEKLEEVTINIPAAVSKKFQTIVNEGEVKKILEKIIKEAAGNVSFDGDKITYTTVNPTTRETETKNVDLSKFIKLHETVTTLKVDKDGNLVYTSEDKGTGKITTINIPQVVGENFTKVLKIPAAESALKQYITAAQSAPGSLNFDGRTFSYKDAAGNVQTLTIEQLVKKGESNTKIEKHPTKKGVYVYINEKKDNEVEINVPEAVSQNFKEIINNPTYKDEIVKIIKQIAGGGDVKFDGTNLTYSVPKKDIYGLVEQDSQGNPIMETKSVKIAKLIKDHETPTTLKLDANTGAFTYENEKGDKVTVNIPKVVGEKFTEVLKIPAASSAIKQFITAASSAPGTLNFDGTTFSYKDEEGNVHTLSIKDLVKKGETETTLSYNKTTGDLTYNNEKAVNGDTSKVVKVNLPKAVSEKFMEIVNNPGNQAILKRIVKESDGNVTYENGDLKYSTTTTNSAGDKVITYKSVPLVDFVKKHETVTHLSYDAATGNLVYKNEEAARQGAPATKTVKVNIPNVVTEKFKEIINNPANVTELTKIFNDADGNVTYDGRNLKYSVTKTDPATGTITKEIREVPLKDFVQKHETVTTLKVDNGSLVYQNEEKDGAGKVVPGKTIKLEPVIEKIIKEIKPGDNLETVLKQFITNHAPEGVSYNEQTGILTYGKNKTIDLKKLVADNETPTSLKFQRKGALLQDATGHKTADYNLVYTGEDGVAKDFPFTDYVRQGQTVTALVVDEKEVERESRKIKQYKLIYKDERGVDSEIKLESFIKANQTVTKLDYDSEKHTISYIDEEGETVEFELKDLVGDVEHLTVLSLDRDNRRLLYKDEHEKTHSIDLAPILQEPWFGVLSNKGAISNTEDIYTGGWVGIGTRTKSNVPNEKLRVNGSISVVNGSYADYVFEDYFDGFSNIKYDYKFKDLKTVEEYIKTNRHLPGITPIHELEKTAEGYSFNISDLSIQLLEKTEELYLHMIEQKNVIDQKDQQIKMLEEANKAVQDRLEKLENLLLNK